MKPSTTDDIKGTVHEVKGKVKETAGKVRSEGTPILQAIALTVVSTRMHHELVGSDAPSLADISLLKA